MNGIERITQRIDSEAQAGIDQLLGDAKNEALRIARQYQEQAEAEAADHAARSQRAAGERRERLVSVAQMEARKVTLGARREMVEKAFALALEKLCGMPEDQYVETAARLMAQAVRTGRESAVFSPKDQAVGRAAVARVNGDGRTLTLDPETRDIPGGFILVDGKVEINCTFDTLVRLQKTEIAGEVAKRLFPAE